MCDPPVEWFFPLIIYLWQIRLAALVGKQDLNFDVNIWDNQNIMRGEIVLELSTSTWPFRSWNCPARIYDLRRKTTS